MQGKKKQRGQEMSMKRSIYNFGERTGRALVAEEA